MTTMNELLEQRTNILKAFMETDDEDVSENLEVELEDNTGAIDDLIFEVLERNNTNISNLLKLKEET